MKTPRGTRASHGTRAAKPRERERPARPRPNRIFELTKARGWTYADVAERVRTAAEARGDKARIKVHELTINRLALGSITLSQDWMTLLGEIYSVPAIEIISEPLAKNMRRVRVVYRFEADSWNDQATLAESERYDVMVPDDAALRSESLYGAVIIGPAMNLRYSQNSIVITSKLTQRPGEIVEGRRYHVAITREADGMIENTVKLLIRGPEGNYWLKPESNHPAHQEWIPLEGKPGIKVELIGRVRGVYFRED